MRKEKVLLHAINISKKGERRTFEVRIPKDAVYLIGFETTVRVNSSPVYIPVGGEPFSPPPGPPPPIPYPTYPVNEFLKYRPTILAGDIRLMSHEEAHLFYAEDVYLFDNNLHHGNPIVLGQPAVVLTVIMILPAPAHDKEYTHGYQKQEDRIKVDGDTTLIKGYYRDRLGEYFDADINYTVNLYTWIER